MPTSKTLRQSLETLARSWRERATTVDQQTLVLEDETEKRVVVVDHLLAIQLVDLCAQELEALLTACGRPDCFKCAGTGDCRFCDGPRGCSCLPQVLPLKEPDHAFEPCEEDGVVIGCAHIDAASQQCSVPAALHPRPVGR